MSIVLLGSTSGSITLQEPAVAGTTTLNLPATSGTVLSDASSLPSANLTGDVAAARITTALNATGSAPIYACRAWVNFDGTGTVAIRASGNVSSITDNGTGDYTVNFTTAMPDANYSVSGVTSKNANTNTGVFISSQATSNVRVLASVTDGLFDQPTVCVNIFR